MKNKKEKYTVEGNLIRVWAFVHSEIQRDMDRERRKRVRELLEKAKGLR